MRARILPPSPENLRILAQAIQQGEVVGMPTETVYGLAGDCFNPVALARIFETKERPTFDPLIVHVGLSSKSVEDLDNKSVEDLDNKSVEGLDNKSVEALDKQKIIDASQLGEPTRALIDRLIQAFWPGPLTLILPKGPRIPDLATSGLPTVAVRMPEHPLAQALIQAAQRPLAAPSANRFGRISPTTAQAVAEELGERIDWILEGGKCAIGLESTILSINATDSSDVRILRAGGTSKESIEKILGFPILTQSTVNHAQPATTSAYPEAPGMLESHYAPRKPFILLNQPLSKLSDAELVAVFKQLKNKLLEEKFISADRAEVLGQAEVLGRAEVSETGTQFPTVGILLLSGDPEAARKRIAPLTSLRILTRSLSRKSDLREAAHRLFSEMRELDSSSASIILVEPCQAKEGLGFAIADRLKRASAGSRGLAL